MIVDPGVRRHAASPPPRGTYQDPARRREEVRASLRRMLSDDPPWRPHMTVEDVEAPGLGGEPSVRLRVLRPESATASSRGVVIWLHGGAFISGDLETDWLISGRYAHEIGVVVVHVDYRLAPEHPYPAAVLDAHAALRWTRAHSQQLEIDPDRLVVAGSSAGGALAAGLVLRARDEGDPAPALVALLHPVLDDRMTTASARTSVATPVFTTEMVSDMWQHYLGDRAGGPDVSPYAAPAREADLSGFPPTYVMVADLDPLHDEGVELAGRLREAGVDVLLDDWPGSVHGFMNFDADLSRVATARFVDVVRQAIDSPST